MMMLKFFDWFRHRHIFLLFLPLALFSGCARLDLSAAAASTPFTFETAVDEARRLSQSPYMNPAGEVPERLMKIDYDDWRDIRFKPPKALWRDENLPFTLQFFHPGLYFDRTVKINVIEPSGTIHPVRFSKDLFDYKKKRVADLVPDDLGFAGFRIHYPINTPEYQDEVAVFLGASYFRAVGQNMNYGLSARGLAVDTTLPSGEEFPYFRKFWIQKPAPDAKTLTLYAILDGPSIVGAYQFVIHPGKETVMDVRSTLFPRRKIEQLGIAPMTSMFFYGENTYPRPVDDFRPEIHDTDGLMMETGSGEWIWRPLVNPPKLLVTSFQMTNPKGFGLLQRDQAYDHYQDIESNYENRPSLWVAPVGNWGDGRVQLIMIPTDEEIHDNIVAFWVPATPPPVGQPVSFDYRMSWHYFADGHRPPGAYVDASRTADGKAPGLRKFVVDFTGGDLTSLAGDQPLAAAVHVSPNATLVEQQLAKVPQTGHWRLVFQIDPEKPAEPGPAGPIEIRAFLKRGPDVLSETWSYVYQP
ncbi:MAG: glucan biosynthesis protein G [Desulfobacterales bacterium]